MTVKHDDQHGQKGTLNFGWRNERVAFIFTVNDAVLVSIDQDFAATWALDYGMAYDADPITGDLSRIDDLPVRARDQLGDFLADRYLGAAAHLPQPEAAKPASRK